MKQKLIQLVVLTLFLNLSASAQNGAHTLLASGPCSPIIPLICASGVENPELAVDNDLTTYATMRTSVGLLSSSFLKMGFNTPAPGGYTVGIFTDESTVLDVDVLASTTITLYNSSNQQIAKRAGLSVLDVQVDAQHHGIILIRVPKTKTAASVQLTVGGLLLLENDVKVYGALYAPNNTPVLADYVYASGPCDPIIPIICPGGVVNAGNAVDADKFNYALLAIPLGIGGNAYLDLGWSNPGPKGSGVWFTLGTNTLALGTSLLANLNMKVYDQNGNVMKEQNGFTLADIQLLDDNKFLIHVKTNKNGNYSIARARVTLTSLVSVLTDLRVYNAYWKTKVNFASYFPKIYDEGEMASMENDLALYPNPSANYVNVMLNDLSFSTAAIEVMNMVGETVYSGEIVPGTPTTIDMHNFESGVYLVKATENGKITRQKLVVQK